MIRPAVWWACGALGVPLAGSLTFPLRADLAVLVPVADTTLIEEAPINNSGGVPFVNAGTTQNFTRNRGLFRFDLRSGIPAGASVTSAEATVYGLEDSPYTFGPTPALAADVQTWIDTPDGNFGWALVGQTEPVDFTARRFASREDASRAALLRVAFLPPPRIEHAAVVGSNLVLQFTARAGQVYGVESRERFAAGTAWFELTNVPAPPALTNVTVVDPLSPGQRFYRLRLP